MRTHTEIDERSLAMARTIVAKIERESPDDAIVDARRRCERWAISNPNTYLDRWRKILESPWEQIRRMLLDSSEIGTSLRQCNPFCGVLSPQERWDIYRRFRDKHES